MEWNQQNERAEWWAGMTFVDTWVLQTTCKIVQKHRFDACWKNGNLQLHQRHLLHWCQGWARPHDIQSTMGLTEDPMWSMAVQVVDQHAVFQRSWLSTGQQVFEDKDSSIGAFWSQWLPTFAQGESQATSPAPQDVKGVHANEATGVGWWTPFPAHAVDIDICTVRQRSLSCLSHGGHLSDSFLTIIMQTLTKADTQRFCL
jgi:hypothetical protein